MAERRRQYYTDQSVQGYLLIGVITVEFLLVCVTLWFMHAEISDIIISHLFRIHPVPSGAWPELFTVLATAMASFLLLNTLLLFLAHTLWSRYIKKTVQHFSMLLDKLRKREFTALPVTLKRQHPTAGLMELWYEKEKARDLRIQTLLSKLTHYQQKTPQVEDRDEILKTLQEYRRLLQG